MPFHVIGSFDVNYLRTLLDDLEIWSASPHPCSSSLLSASVLDKKNSEIKPLAASLGRCLRGWPWSAVTLARNALEDRSIAQQAASEGRPRRTPSSCCERKGDRGRGV